MTYESNKKERIASMIVLIVEDNELNRDMLSRRLMRRGFATVLAVDGVEALTLAQSKQPDVILMDLSLPGMSGIDATRLLRANTLTSKIPIIALTAHASGSDRDDALQAGCDDYDTKPVDMATLVEKLEFILTRTGALSRVV